MDSEASAERRLLAVQRSAGLQWESAPQQILSHSNDAWLVKPKDRGACVLRVAWRGWVGRMLTESSLAASLPAVVGSPEVLASGSSRLGDLRLAWSLSRRLSGTTLAEAWPQLGARRRRAAGESIARRLRALHAWRPPSSLAARLLERPRPETPDSVVGTTINPLPMERLALLVEPAADRVPGRRDLVARAMRWLMDHAHLAAAYDEPDQPVTHGDLHLSNVWWDGSQVAGLLDLEMARFAPAYVDLARLHDNAASGHPESRDAHREIAADVIKAYPELAVPQLADRLRYLRLAYEIRELLIRPAAEQCPGTDHPLTRLEELLAG